MNFKRLSSMERDVIGRLRSEGKTWREIGAVLGRSHSSLIREWQRNRHKPSWGARLYLPHTAQKKSDERLRQSHRRFRLKSMEMRLEVLRLLEQRWSPELIAGRLKRIRPELPTISHEAIYQWIYHQRRDLIPYLARAHRRRFPRRSPFKHRQKIPGRRSIVERPLAVQNRSEAGHWETDLMVMQGAYLQVSVERQSRYTLLERVSRCTASICRATLTRTLEQVPSHLRRSMTYDNGPENYEHQVLNEDYGMESYFCAPYHSWEKGTVENTNGLIRWWLPRQTQLMRYSPVQIRALQNWLNNRPRKILNYQTPREAFEALGAIEP